MTDTSPTGQLEITGNLPLYKQPEPLSLEAHGNLGISGDPEHPFTYIKDVQVLPIAVGEFPAASLSYPIIFAGPDKNPAVILGMTEGRNAFVDEEGHVPDGVYLPAYIRRYPFIAARNNDNPDNMMVCIDRASHFISDKPDEPFFKDGQPTDFTKRCIDFVQSYEQEMAGTRNFVKMLEDLDLFDTIDAFIPGEAGTEGVDANGYRKIGEYVGVSKTKLDKISPEKLAELRDNGALLAIYAHQMSQTNWQRVVTMEIKHEQDKAKKA